MSKLLIYFQLARTSAARFSLLCSAASSQQRGEGLFSPLGGKHTLRDQFFSLSSLTAQRSRSVWSSARWRGKGAHWHKQPTLRPIECTSLLHSLGARKRGTKWVVVLGQLIEMTLQILLCYFTFCFSEGILRNQNEVSRLFVPVVLPSSASSSSIACHWQFSNRFTFWFWLKLVLV